MIFLKYLLFLSMATSSFTKFQTASEPHTGSLHLQVQSIAKKEGCLRIALYNKETSFLKDEYSYLEKVFMVEQEGEMEITLPGLQYDQYALAIYHDVNNNDKLDKNILGIPKEPYGFSNNPKAKWRSPKFHEALFQIDDAQKKLVIDVKRWKNW